MEEVKELNDVGYTTAEAVEKIKTAINAVEEKLSMSALKSGVKKVRRNAETSVLKELNNLYNAVSNYNHPMFTIEEGKELIANIKNIMKKAKQEGTASFNGRLKEIENEGENNE